eukprot:s3940_g5.t1
MALRARRACIPMKKGLALLTNSHEFAEEISNRCDGTHEHQRVHGRETSRTAVYPDEFAKATVKAFDAWKNYAKVGVWSEDWGKCHWAATMVAPDLNEIVAVDILWFDTAESPNHLALNVIDLASISGGDPTDD